MCVTIRKDNFEEEVIRSVQPVLVGLWAPWCQPCKEFIPDLDYVEKRYNGKIKVGKINIDSSPQMAVSLGVECIPFLLIFKRGKVVRRNIGALPRHELVEFVRPYVER